MKRKLFGAAATNNGSRACASGESKLQLIRSTPAFSAAAASSGDLTLNVRQAAFALELLKIVNGVLSFAVEASL